VAEENEEEIRASMLTTLVVDIQWGIDRNTGEPACIYKFTDPMDGERVIGVGEILQCLEFVKFSAWQDGQDGG
jgi:hypothetical protein